MPEERQLTNGGQVFVPISNREVWEMLVKLDKKIDKLSVKIYSFAGAITAIGVFIGLTGGIKIGQ